MAMTESPMVVGIFRDRSLAERAVEELRRAGFRDDQVRLAGQTAPAGGLLDHLASALSGHETTGGKLPEELASKGVPQDEADYYQHEADAGHAVVLVESYGHQQQARDILQRYGAYDARTHAAQAESGRIIPVREEVLEAHKQLVVTGEVVIRKQVITEEKTITVPITREEVVIERRPSTGERAAQPMNEGETLEEALKEGGTLRIVVREEQVRVEKYPVVKEEIFITKRQIQESKHISDSVKREEAHLEGVGNVNIHGSEVDDGSREPESEA
ncbi:MAG: YsnF/AvaK domain-containing protein [Ktedonobacteraceae bacterium]